MLHLIRRLLDLPRESFRELVVINKDWPTRRRRRGGGEKPLKNWGQVGGIELISLHLLGDS